MSKSKIEFDDVFFVILILVVVSVAVIKSIEYGVIIGVIAGLGTMAIPFIAGIFSFNWLWENGYPNLGMIILVVSIVFQVVHWFWAMSGTAADIGGGGGDSGTSFYERTKAVYDKHGNVKGYIDKD